VVTVEIRAEAQAVTGTWSDGTLSRGTQGLLKGMMSGRALQVALCDEGGEVGGYPACPKFSAVSERFVRRGDALVWSRQIDGTPWNDLVLRPAAAQVQPVCTTH